MAQLKIVRSDEVQPQNIRGLGKEAGQIKRIIATEKFFFNVDEVSPGFSPHHWHQHTKYQAEGVEVEYPAPVGGRQRPTDECSPPEVRPPWAT